MTLLEDRLYHDDRYAWLQEQAAILRRLARSPVASDLDLDHLAEEIEDLGKSERRAVRSQMRRLLEHLLKLEHSAAAEPGAGWHRSVLDARIDLADDLTPALRREVEADLAGLYAAAREQAALALAAHGEEAAAGALPQDCPYSLARLLDREWLPI